MKFRNILTAAILSAAVLFTACKKDDGAIKKKIGIEDVPAMTMNLDPQKKNNEDTIRFGNQAAFNTKFNVNMIFPTQMKPTKVDIVIRKNTTNTNVKVFKADVSTYPTSFSITAADLATLFGTPLALNDIYDIGPDIYANSKKYEAFPALAGAGNGSGVIGMNSIGYYEVVRIQVKN